MKSKVDMRYKPGESDEQYLLRTSLEAEQESDKLGWIGEEQAGAEMAKHKHEFYKEYLKTKAA